MFIEIKTDRGLYSSVFVDAKKILDESMIDMSLSNGLSLSTDEKKHLQKNGPFV